MADQFLLPKDPRLSFGMLFPSSKRNHPHASVSGSRTHYLFWARNAIYHGLRALNVKPGGTVLVPSYHCTSVVEPICNTAATCRPRSAADIDDIEKRIDARTRVVLVVHYFGFPQPIVKIKEFCKERGLYLIEDCAHVLQGRTEEGIVLGTSGDISIFSWRKFFPVYDGGQLVINALP